MRPAKMHASGYVFATDQRNHSFFVTVWQKIVGVPPLTPLTIRAILRECNSLERSNVLPPLNTVVAFSGHILGFKDGVLFAAVFTTSYYSESSEESDEFNENEEGMVDG